MMSVSFHWIFYWILLLLSFGICNGSTKGRKGCKALRDLIICVDASDSISTENYETFKRSISELIERMDIGPDRSRLGIVVYSSNVTVAMPISSNKINLRLRSLTLPHFREGTNTAKCIRTMRKLFEDNRRDAPMVGLVMTDGISKEPNVTALEAKLTRDIGVTMNAVGVSEFARMDELIAIAGAEERVFPVSSFQELANSINDLVKLVCPTTTTTTTSTTTTTTTTTTSTTTTTTTTPTTTTTTTTTTPTTTTTTMPPSTTPPKGVCDDCVWYNTKICYRPHPEDCSLYIMCKPGTVGIHIIYARCPFGHFYNHLTLSCRPADQCYCPKDKCHIPGLVSYAENYIKNKRVYWECVNQRSVPKCCPRGYVYKIFTGCTKDKSCSDYSKCSYPCPLVSYERNICLTKRVKGCRNKFYLYVKSMGWTGPHLCRNGAIYDSKHCGCKYSVIRKRKVCRKELYLPFDVDYLDYSGNQVVVQNMGVQILGNGKAYFDGYSKLVIPKLPILDTYSEIVVKIRYKETGYGVTRALFSNSDCNKCLQPSPSTMSLTSSQSYVSYLAATTGGTVTTFEIPSHQPGSWNIAKYTHDNIKLCGNVNGMVNSELAVGRIRNNNAPLQIGFNHGYRNFKGYMDEFVVLSCKFSYHYKPHW